MSATPFRGFSPKLQQPEDLLAKLHRDWERLRGDPTDQDAAFCFFVTANHLPDWIHDLPIRGTNPVLRIVEHLATGFKHLEPSAPKHTSVHDVRERRGVFQPGVFQGDVFDVGGFVIELTPAEATDLGMPEIEILDLARRVLAFWDQRLNPP